MKIFYTALMLAAVSLGAMGTAMADDITADVLTYDGKTKVVSAKGNVVIHANEGATITGTNGEYHFEDRSAFLEGGVKYVKEQSTLTAEKMYLYKDRTARGIGSVDFVDLSEHRILRGDDVMYNAATGFGKIEGNGYLETADGTLSAPHIEGNLKQIKVVATGGVDLTSTTNNAVGYGDQAVYTRSGRDGTDGKMVLSGNAWVEQNGNTFEGPELVLVMRTRSSRQQAAVRSPSRIPRVRQKKAERETHSHRFPRGRSIRRHQSPAVPHMQAAR